MKGPAMIDPTEADIGRRVIYHGHGWTDKTEEGTITSFNDSFVFVCYGFLGSTSAATLRKDLEWSHQPSASALACG